MKDTVQEVLRAPMPLQQVEPESCMSCLTAQARWILGTSDLQGQTAVAEVDRLTGRKTGELISAVPSVCLHLTDGCTVRRYKYPNPDLDRLRRHDLTYFRDWCAQVDRWDAEDEEFWTPAEIDRLLARWEREDALLAHAGRHSGGRLVDMGEPFTRQIADELLADGWIISTAFLREEDRRTESQAVLIHSRSADGSYKLYSPTGRHDGLVWLDTDRFAASCQPYADAIKPASRSGAV